MTSEVINEPQKAGDNPANQPPPTEFYNLFMQAPAAICILKGAQHVFELTNDLYLQLAGKTNILGRTVREAFPELEGQGFFELLDQVYQTGEPFVGKEIPITLEIHDTGALEQKYLNFVYQPFRDTAGQIQGILVHATDITEQVIARRRAEEAEKQLQNLANNMPQLVSMIRADGYVYWYNSQWYNYTGRTPADMEGWGWQSVHDPAVLPEVLEKWQAAIQTGQNFEMIFPLKGADGVFRPFLTRVTPIRNAAGQVVQWFGTNTDISEQIRVENELKKSEAKLKALYESNIIGVLYCDLTGRVFDANDVFLKMLGYSRADLENGQINWAALTPPEHQANDVRGVELLRTVGFIEPWEKEYIRKDGRTIPVIVGAATIDFNSGETIAFVMDITERKQLEQRKDEFIGLASHELKTPLTAAKGYTQLLERLLRGSGEDRAKTYIDKINTNMNRLSALVNDLLDVSKIEAGKVQLDKTVFAFDEMVKEAVESTQLVTNTHVISYQPPAAPLKITGDRQRLEQVLTNLLSNAVKYSPESHRVIVTVETTSRPGFVTVGVQDFGVGISRDQQGKIFERFYRAEEHARQFAGLGMGLYISKDIVNRHGGQLWVESEAGQGATFYFSLPLAA